MREFSVGDWIVWPERNAIAKDGIERRLEPRVMDLLVYLARHAGQVVGRERLIAAVWPHSFVSDSALQSAVSVLRKALNDNARTPAIIETIPKRGYRLIAPSSAAKPVVAVMPFDNLTGLDDRQHVADGLTDTLIAELGRHSGIDAISRQSVVEFRGTALSRSAIAHRLGATAMVEGAVLRAQESLSANVQLVDPVTGTHLLAETVQLDPGRLFAQQATLARRIATSLLAGKEAPVTSAPQREVDPEAMNHYLLGRFHWYKLDPAHFPEALRHFESAIAIDPGFSAAHAGIADVWGAFGYWGVMPATEVRDKVWASTEKALQHDPLSAEAHMLAGAYWLFVEHDWSAAQASLEKAMDLNPSLAHAHLLYGLFLGTTGGGDARTHFATAQQLDPLNPAMHFGAAICAAAGNRLDDAARWVERSLELEPGFRPGLELRADLAWRAGNADALEFERALWPADQDVSRTLAPGAGVSASEQLAGSAAVLERRSRKQYVSPRVIARLYGLATNTAKAIDVLARAIDAADLMQPDLVCMMPAFEDVRQDRRFSDLRARLGLRPYRS